MWTYYIWFEAEFTGEGLLCNYKSVQPTVRPLCAESRTAVEENGQKSSFFEGFMNN